MERELNIAERTAKLTKERLNGVSNTLQGLLKEKEKAEEEVKMLEDGKYFKRKRACIAYMERTVVYRHSNFYDLIILLNVFYRVTPFKQAQTSLF